MEKEIKLNNGDTEVLTKFEKTYNDIYCVTKTYYEDDQIVKTLIMTFCVDINFSGNYYGDGNRQAEESYISFDFDVNDPLYFCLNRFLNGQESVIVQDDHTYADLVKYFEVVKTDGKIILTIYCNKRSYPGNKFKIFVKGNLIDPSNDKIGMELREQIFNLFSDMIQTLNEDVHQITFDEHIEVLKRTKKDY